jgi:hypothetical protein
VKAIGFLRVLGKGYLPGLRRLFFMLYALAFLGCVVMAGKAWAEEPAAAVSPEQNSRVFGTGSGSGVQQGFYTHPQSGDRVFMNIPEQSEEKLEGHSGGEAPALPEIKVYPEIYPPAQGARPGRP